MTKQEHINYWLKSAEEDFETMNYLKKGKRFVHSLFFGHLYLEKISKALWVKNNKANHPPRIHNLLTLLEQANVKLNESQLLFLLKMNQYHIDGRYPEDIERLKKITSGKLANEYFSEIKTMEKCLLKELQ